MKLRVKMQLSRKCLSDGGGDKEELEASEEQLLPYFSLSHTHVTESFIKDSLLLSIESARWTRLLCSLEGARQ